MRVLGGAVLIVLLATLAAVSQAPDDKLIAGGQRIGRWTLQMTVADLIRLNGAPNVPAGASAVRRAPPWLRDVGDVYWLWWTNHSLLAATLGREGQQVIYLGTTSEDYRTDKGIGNGATRDAVETAYGKSPLAGAVPGAPERWRMIYDEIGLAFLARGRPTPITDYVFVFRPGAAIFQ